MRNHRVTNIFRGLNLALIGVLATSCAGPYTPMGALNPTGPWSNGEQQLPPALPETLAWANGQESNKEDDHKKKQIHTKQGIETSSTQKSLSVVKEFDTWPYRGLFMANHSGGLYIWNGPSNGIDVLAHLKLAHIAKDSNKSDGAIGQAKEVRTASSDSSARDHDAHTNKNVKTLPDDLWSHLEPLSEALHPHTQIEYGPRGMVFNINSPLTISIKTKTSLNNNTARAMVFLNGRNITSQSTSQFIGKNQITLKFPHTFFNKNKNYNLVTFFRENNYQPWQYKIYQESTCSLRNTKNKIYRPAENSPEIKEITRRTLASTLTQTMGRFENIIRPSELLHELELESEKGKINPALVYGLIMQESGFDPKAFSKARALGLSQMTRRAAITIMPPNEEWPLLEKIDTMPWFEVKLGLLSGEIDEDHDWRLIPKSSLRGGISYLKYLTQFWEKELELSTNASHLSAELLEMIRRDAWTIRDKSSEEYRDLILTQLVLASYNMGPNRVRQFSQYHKEERTRYLQGIRGYLRGIKSYCQLASE